jgi:hypothetical protein
MLNAFFHAARRRYVAGILYLRARNDANVRPAGRKNERTMTDKPVKNSLTVFERIRKTDGDGSEYWSAREMAKVLEYSEYRHFVPVMERAAEACRNSGQPVFDHFEDILEMIETGKTARREVESVKLSRYAAPSLRGAERRSNPTRRNTGLPRRKRLAMTKKAILPFAWLTQEPKKGFCRLRG